MKAELMRHLACPQCRETLHIEEAAIDPEAGDIRSGLLRCSCAGYPIRGSVPRFCEDDYAESFGMQWNIFRQTQLDRLELDNSEERFSAEIGFPLSSVRGRLVLDAGCGMGRFADVVSRWGGTVVGIDMSISIEAAFDNIGRRPNVHLVQADIGKLPFEERTFDYIYSIGVLHHTPNPPYFFSRLVPFLKPGGMISICVYSREVGSLALAKRSLYRRVFQRLSKPSLLSVSRRFGSLGYRLAKTPVLRKTVGLLPAVVYPDKPQEWSELDTFDWLAPAYEFRYTRAEVREWFAAAGLAEIRVINDVPGWVCVSGVAQKTRFRDAVGV